MTFLLWAKERQDTRQTDSTTLMKCAQERNLKFNPQEIEFKLPKITFMGHVISDQGVEGHK